jgi:ABC-type nitrate/sulfonate/bicarbonate transport system permease component
MDYVMVGMLMIGLIGLLLDYLMKRLGAIESTQWGSTAR